VEIYHLLSILQERVKFEKIKDKVINPLNEMKIGAYYGCLLVRPQKYAIDDFENPSIMETLIESLGGKAVDYIYKLECCGAYQTLTKKEVSIMRTYEILQSANHAGCEAIMTSCPLCAYNLDFLQKDIERKHADFSKIPVFYFTELMAIALGVNWKREWTRQHDVNPEPLLKRKKLI